MTYGLKNGWTIERMIAQVMLRNNGARSTGLVQTALGGGTCRYRGDGGNCCLVGAFIPDELYHPRMEGMSIKYLLSAYPAVRQHMPLEEAGLYGFQAAHDQCSDGDDPRSKGVAWIRQNTAEAA